MKTIVFILNIVVFNLLISETGIAQKEEQMQIPFSKPGEPGFLNVEVFQGNIYIQGYDGKEVLLELSPGQQEFHDLQMPVIPKPFDADTENEEISKEGLKKIKSSSFEINVTEEENKITIKSGSPMNFNNFNIKVPFNCSLKLSTINGNISVKDVRGELEINTINGQINLDKITGSAVVSTINGILKVIFKEVTPDAPMVFSTINSHIDVTLPSSIKATLKMKTDGGDIYSNFDMDIKEEEEKSHTEYRHGYTESSWTRWTTGNLNGGGPELVFKSLHGDIHIRKGE